MKKIIAWDTETFRLGPANMAPRIVASTWCSDPGNPGILAGWWGQHRHNLGNWLELAKAGEITIVGHNVAYDFGCLMSMYPDLVPDVFAAFDADGVEDTQLRQKLLDIAEGQHRGYTNAGSSNWTKHGYSLKDLAARLLKIEMSKDQDVRTNFGDLWGVDPLKWPQASYDYALKDADITLQVWMAQEARNNEKGGSYLVDQHRQARAALALHLAEVWGIRTDRTGVQGLYDRTEEVIKRIQEGLIREGLVRENGSRNMKVAYARMNEAWPDCPKTAKRKDPKINAETCEESGDHVLMDLAEYQRKQNVLNKDCKELAVGTEMPIHTRFDPLMDTGRTSSSSPNIQNVKREPGIRECYVPRAGFLFCSCDYSQLEMYTLAQVQYYVFGRSCLGEALKVGKDPHLLVAAQALGAMYEDVAECRHDPEVKEARQHSKPVNFGIAGGMGVQGLLAYAKGAYGIAFTEEQAKAMIDHYHSTWPDMQEYFDWVRSLCGESGSTTIKHFGSDRIRGHIRFTVACNSFFQGLAADGAKAAAYLVARKEYAEPGNALYGCRTVNFIHDELIVEVPDDKELAHAAAMELQATMVEAFQPWCPDLQVKAEPALMRRWSKKAEPAWDNGMLVPWEETCSDEKQDLDPDLHRQSV